MRHLWKQIFSHISEAIHTVTSVFGCFGPKCVFLFALIFLACFFFLPLAEGLKGCSSPSQIDSCSWLECFTELCFLPAVLSIIWTFEDCPWFPHSSDFALTYYKEVCVCARMCTYVYFPTLFVKCTFQLLSHKSVRVQF